MKEKAPLTSKEQIHNRERWLKQLPESIFFWPTISKEDRAQIENFRELLAKNPTLNVVLYFNHTSYVDPLYAGYIANLIDPEMTRELIAPMSYYHTENKNWQEIVKNYPILAIKNKAEDCGIIISRIIQSYQVDNPKYPYTKEQAYKINKEFPQTIRQKQKEGKSLIIMISPEGHRSKGSLIKAETGMAMVGQITNALYIPIGIDYKGITTRVGFHIGETIIKIGQVTKHNPNNNLDDQTKILMKNLADVLPPKRKGYYNNLMELPKTRE